MRLVGPTEPQAPAAGWSLKDVAWGGRLGAVLFLGVVVAAAGLDRGPELAGTGHWRGLLVALAEAIFIIPVWAFAVRRPAVRWRDLGLRGFRPLQGCMAAAGFLYFSLSVNLIWGLVLRWLGWAGQPDVRPLFGQGAFGLALALVGTAVVAPLAEELFFRGFAFPPLRRRLGLWAAVAVDAALFTALHFTPTVFPPIFVLGVLFCLIYQYTGSLWPGVILHASVNTLSVLAAYLLRA